MSKKMMKRSLALGALMAFVITGSAMAAEKGYGITNSAGAPMYDCDVSIPSADLVDVGEAKYTVKSQGILVHGNDSNNPRNKNSIVNVHAKSMEVESEKIGFQTQYNGQLYLAVDDYLKINAATHGISSGAQKNSNIIITAPNANLSIIAGENAIDARAKTDNDENIKSGIKITANNIAVESTNTGEQDKDWKGFALLARGVDSELVIDATGDVDITSKRTAIYANKGSISVIGKTIDIIAGEGAGVRAGTSASDAVRGNGNVVLGNDNTEGITIEGTMDYGIIARAKNNTGDADVQSSVVVNGESLVIGAKDSSEIYAGICAASGTEAEAGYNSSSVTVNTGYTEINADYGIYNMSNGNVTVNGDLTINANESAIITRGYADTVINGNNDENITVKINGDIEFNKYYDNNSSVTDSNVVINLANADSFLNGNIIVTNADRVAEANKATMNDITGMELALSNGATWNVTGNSFVNTLNGDGGRMELATLETDNGKRLAEVKIGQNNATNLTIYGDETLTKDIENGEVKQDDALGYIAGAVEGANKNTTVAIAEGEIIGEITASVGADGEVVADSVKEAVNPVNKSIGEASVVGMAHIRAHMNDMNKRMGELRMANGEAGIWTRMVRGEEEFAGAKSQYNQYQLGYDEKISVDKRWTVGAAVTFAEGNGNFANGSTENDSTAFAIYGSKLNNDGTFVDLIARYARFESDITVADAKSDYSTNGMSVSAEFGKRIQQGNGLWIEPQFELTYGSVDSAEYKLGDKIVQVGDMDSLIGRVGFSLGKDIKQGNVYARASYLYDFDGETETTFGNGSVTRTIEEDLGGGWFEVGVGANINLSKATYIYADVEKTFGGEVDTNWKWNLGVRYSF